MPYVGHYGDLFAIAAKKRIAYRLRRVVGYAKGQHRYAAYEEITPALEYTYAFRRHLAYKRLHGLPCGGVGVYRYAVTPAKHADARYVVCMLMGDEYGGYVLYSFPGKGKGSRYGAGAFARVYHEKAAVRAYKSAVAGGAAEQGVYIHMLHISPFTA